MSSPSLWDYARFTRQDKSHHQAFWNAVEDSLTSEQRKRIASGGDLNGIWESSGSEAAAAKDDSFNWLPLARKIVREFEGCKLIAYPDPASGGDPWTIGWGHTGPDVKKGVKWTQQQADTALELDLRRFHSGFIKVLPISASWKPNEQAALVSFAFNVGLSAVAGSTLIRRLLAKESPSLVISEELPRWNKGEKDGKSYVMPGLTRRRAAEVELFTGVPTKAPVVSRAWPAGSVGPKMQPTLKPGDHHLIANDLNNTLTAYTHDGKRLWSVPCLCRGQGGEAEWSATGSDTPPGLYKIGQVYRDYEQDSSERFTADRRAYGWYSFDLIGLEGQEGPDSKPHRDGIMIHGGGSACGWPGAWAPRQVLHPTLGCIRCHNQDLRERILPLLSMGTIWVSVLQEAS